MVNADVVVTLSEVSHNSFGGKLNIRHHFYDAFVPIRVVEVSIQTCDLYSLPALVNFVVPAVSLVQTNDSIRNRS